MGILLQNLNLLDPSIPYRYTDLHVIDVCICIFSLSTFSDIIFNFWVGSHKYLKSEFTCVFAVSYPYRRCCCLTVASWARRPPWSCSGPDCWACAGGETAWDEASHAAPDCSHTRTATCPASEWQVEVLKKKEEIGLNFFHFFVCFFIIGIWI